MKYEEKHIKDVCNIIGMHLEPMEKVYDSISEKYIYCRRFVYYSSSLYSLSYCDTNKQNVIKEITKIKNDLKNIGNKPTKIKQYFSIKNNEFIIRANKKYNK